MYKLHWQHAETIFVAYGIWLAHLMTAHVKIYHGVECTECLQQNVRELIILSSLYGVVHSTPSCFSARYFQCLALLSSPTIQLLTSTSRPSLHGVDLSLTAMMPSASNGVPSLVSAWHMSSAMRGLTIGHPLVCNLSGCTAALSACAVL